MSSAHTPRPAILGRLDPCFFTYAHAPPLVSPARLAPPALLLRHQLKLPRAIADAILALFPCLFCRQSRRPLTASALANPRARLSLISRHLKQRPYFELNTPFSSERLAGKQDDPEYTPLVRSSPTMADEKGNSASSQPEHPALLIPGPVEFDDAVLEAMSHYRCASSLQALSPYINP